MRARSLSNVFMAVAASSLVAATPTSRNHRHQHPHYQFEARVAEDIKVVNIAGPTQVVYEFNGHPIDEPKVCQGIQDGSLKWAAGTKTPLKCPIKNDPEPTIQPTFLLTTSAVDQFTPTVVSSSTVAVDRASQPATFVQPSLGAVVKSKGVEQAVTSQSTPSLQQIQSYEQPKTAGITKVTQSISSKSPEETFTKFFPSSSSKDLPNGQGIDREFDDGVLDCSVFPDNYGPINVQWAGLGGWSGVQYVTIQDDFVTHIDTAVSSQPGEKCKPGAMCSYACPPGFQKSQWPSAQGKTGQSVGGLRCDSYGKLRLTNPNLSKRLCIPGTGTTVVQNKLSENAAICRTDYPGTENEVVPLDTQPGKTSPLTCPDAKSYFVHDGSSTTAQYYINNQGVPLNEACIWGSDGTDIGNWAPSYLGVGRDVYGKTYLTIASTSQNDPTKYKPLNYSVEIFGNLSEKCKLKDGRYCSGYAYENCNEKGCTVELLSGQGTYVLSD